MSLLILPLFLPEPTLPQCFYIVGYKQDRITNGLRPRFYVSLFDVVRERASADSDVRHGLSKCHCVPCIPHVALSYSYVDGHACNYEHGRAALATLGFKGSLRSSGWSAYGQSRCPRRDPACFLD